MIAHAYMSRSFTLNRFLLLNSEYKDAFRVFDANGDGQISCKELKTYLNSIGQYPSDSDISKIMKRVDKDG